MQQLPSKHWATRLLMLMPLLVSLACATLAGKGLPAAAVFGPGPFNFPETGAGLADLTSYQATLTLSFDGSKDGQSDRWSKTYVLLSSNTPAARKLTVEKTGNLTDLDPVFMAEVNGVAYESRGQSGCSATVIEPENALPETWEPAGMLNGPIGAEIAGSETVNGAAADHYTFDERAFGERGVAKSTGEMWVASQGGYIVKYLLTSKGNADYFGEGIEGTLTWDYELTDVNQPVTVELPADCPAGMVDAPLLADASNVLNMPGILTFDTASSLKDAAAFYQEQIPKLGWDLPGQPTINKSSALLDFSQGKQKMTVIINADAGVTTINILISGPAQQTVTEGSPAGSQPAAGSLDAPLLPDASIVLNTASTLSYTTSASPADAAAFYQEKIPGLGWTPAGEPMIAETMALMQFTKGDQKMMIVIGVDAGVTTVNIVLE